MTIFTRRTALAALAVAPLALIASRASAATHQITIAGFAFQPAALAIAVGDTVTFTNTDGAPHSAKAADGTFDTGRIDRNGIASITITTTGAHDFGCAFHPSMTGTITAS